MQEVNVKSPNSYILKEATYCMLLSKCVFIEPECYEYNRHKKVHSGCSRQVRPLEFQVVPLENICATEDCDNDNKREEPFGVKYLLPPAPIPVHNIAKQEKVEIFHGLDEARVIKYVRFVSFWECKP